VFDFILQKYAYYFFNVCPHGKNSQIAEEIFVPFDTPRFYLYATLVKSDKNRSENHAAPRA